MPASADPLDTIRRYLKAIETGTFADTESLFTPEMVVEQLPNRIYPLGLRADRTHMSEAFERGRKLLSSQTYEIKHAVAGENTAAVEVLWTGTLAMGFGPLAAGSQMRCHSAMFFQFEEGKISSQRNYDCFEPW